MVKIPSLLSPSSEKEKKNTQKTQLPVSSGETSASADEKEIGGRTEGLEPTRYGDWEKGGRAIDF